MKATGIVRRIDELGRVVIPKEIRRTQRIRQGDALEIFTDAGGEVVFKKYSPLVELGQLSGVYADVLAKNLHCPVLVCDRDTIVAATGPNKADMKGRPVSDAMQKLLAMRTTYTAPADPERRLRALERSDRQILCASPIVAHGDVEGGVLTLGTAKDPPPDEHTVASLAIAAAFLAKWMEE